MGQGVEIPDKLFFRIGEVSGLLGLKPHVLRYWETEFPSLRPQKSRTNQRLYRPKDIEILQQLKQLLHEEGFTIAGARKALSRSRKAVAENEDSDAGQLDLGLQSDEAKSIRKRVSEANSEELARAQEELVQLKQTLDAERKAHQAFRAKFREGLEAMRNAAKALTDKDPDGA